MTDKENQIDMKAFSDGYDQGYEDCKKDLMDKIDKWLEENFYEAHEIDCYGCFSEETEITSSFDTVEEMMESFHKTMEE